MNRLVPAPGVAWVTLNEVVYVAVLPDPPILVLKDGAALIWRIALEVERQRLSEEVARRSGVAVADVHDDIEAFVADLSRRQLLIEA